MALNCTARPTALCVLHVCQGTRQMHNHLEAFLERPHLRQYKGFHLVCSRKTQESNNRLLEQIWHASSNAIGCCGLAVSVSLVVKVACLCALSPRLLSLVASESGIGFQGGGCPLCSLRSLSRSSPLWSCSVFFLVSVVLSSVKSSCSCLECSMLRQR